MAGFTRACVVLKTNTKCKPLYHHINYIRREILDQTKSWNLNTNLQIIRFCTYGVCVVVCVWWCVYYTHLTCILYPTPVPKILAPKCKILLGRSWNSCAKMQLLLKMLANTLQVFFLCLWLPLSCVCTSIPVSVINHYWSPSYIQILSRIGALKLFANPSSPMTGAQKLPATQAAAKENPPSPPGSNTKSIHAQHAERLTPPTSPSERGSHTSTSTRFSSAFTLGHSK